jgi:hypothetical protein
VSGTVLAASFGCPQLPELMISTIASTLISGPKSTRPTGCEVDASRSSMATWPGSSRNELPKSVPVTPASWESNWRSIVSAVSISARAWSSARDATASACWSCAARAASTALCGLGLAIAQQIAAAHGGRIAVESEQGRGSSFVLTLPVSPRAAR